MKVPDKSNRPAESHGTEPQKISDELSERHALWLLHSRAGFLVHFAEFVLSSAARRPFASFKASSFAQKCIKNRRGPCLRMWLYSAVTASSFFLCDFVTGLNSLPKDTKYPVSDP